MGSNAIGIAIEVKIAVQNVRRRLPYDGLLSQEHVQCVDTFAGSSGWP